MHTFLTEDTEFLDRRGYDPTKYRRSIELNINVSQNIVQNYQNELERAIRLNLKRMKAEKEVEEA